MGRDSMHPGGFGVVVLAGGRGMRMGGDKALIELFGKPLLLHVVERALKLNPERIVVAVGRGKLNRYGSILPPIVSVSEDVVEGGGPLAGMISGMRELDSEYTLVLPCDTPFIKLRVLRLLYRRAVGIDAAIPRWPNGYIEPLQAFYRTQAALEAAEEALKRDERSCREMIRLLNRVIYVDIDDLRSLDPKLVTFFNVNSEEDLLRADKFLRKLISNPYQDIGDE